MTRRKELIEAAIAEMEKNLTSQAALRSIKAQFSIDHRFQVVDAVRAFEFDVKRYIAYLELHPHVQDRILDIKPTPEITAGFDLETAKHLVRVMRAEKLARIALDDIAGEVGVVE